MPRCYSTAHSFEDTVPNAIKALSLFFEDGQPVPPHGMQAVYDEVAENTEESSVLMMIPYVWERKWVVRVNLTPDYDRDTPRHTQVQTTPATPTSHGTICSPPSPASHVCCNTILTKPCPPNF